MSESESKSGKSNNNSNDNNGISRTTDWNAYYHQKKSWFSTHTQQFTLALINEALDKYCGLKDTICSATEDTEDAENTGKTAILELGGGGSCFAEAVCGSHDFISAYDIVDKTGYAVDLFNNMSLPVAHRGIRKDLTDDRDAVSERNGDEENRKYDFVYSIGLIEHFTEEDRQKAIKAHFDHCKPGGIVFISFPTPTLKYRFIRKCMELVHAWQFYDEHPLKEEDARPVMEKYADILECKLNKKLPLSQMIIIGRKN